MKQTIGLSEFRSAFHNMGRGNQFSYDGLKALFNYLEEVDEDMELDVIALCCEFKEYEDEEALCSEHGMTIDEISDRAIVIRADNGAVIVSQF